MLPKELPFVNLSSFTLEHLEPTWDARLEQAFRIILLTDSLQPRFNLWSVTGDRILRDVCVIEILETD